MSLRADGSYRCDRCGADIGNAAVQLAAIISDWKNDTVRVLHLCRVNNCDTRVLTNSALADYAKQKVGQASR